MTGLQALLDKGVVRLAKLPRNNYTMSLSELDGYTVPIIGHDYGAITPVMWNAVYEQLGLNVRNVMVVGDPADAEKILTTLRADPKYLGGGAGVGFKEKVIPYLDRTNPTDLRAVNIIVREGKELVGYNTDAVGLRISIENAVNAVGNKLTGGHVLVFGAGGVAKELGRELAQYGVRKIGFVNRTGSKATQIASWLQEEFSELFAYSNDESMIRGTMLCTLDPPVAIVNTTDKGSDGPLEGMSAFAPADITYNNTLSIDNARLLAHWNPKVAVVDIVLPKSGESTTLRHSRSAKLQNLVNGMPMVINQAGPAYELVQSAHPNLHEKKLGTSEILEIMQKATK